MNGNGSVTDDVKWKLSVSKQLGWITGLVTFHSALIGGLIWAMVRMIGLVASLK